jgi:hypothetical protein
MSARSADFHIALLIGLAAACLIVGAASLSAQGPTPVPVHVFLGGPAPEVYGSTVCTAGDVDVDGFGDVAIAVRMDDQSGPSRLEIRSGRDGGLLGELVFDEPGDEKGVTLAPIGDIDGDGHPDLIVGRGDHKRVHVFSGASLALLRRHEVGAGPITIGGGLADIGDLDADGVRDYGIAGDAGDSAGFVSLVSGTDGHVLMLLHGSGPGDLFGSNVAGAGDVNGDGHPDVLVKHNQADIYFQGKVSFISGKDGSLLAMLGGGSMGVSMGGVGDLDGDGGDEVILGAPQLPNPHIMGPGHAYVYSWMQNRTLFEYAGDQTFEEFGYRVGGLGNVDGDAVPDFFITSLNSTPFFGSGILGKAWVRSGADGSVLFSVEGQYDLGGLAAIGAAAGDVDGDGRGDLLLGRSGRVLVHTVSPPFTWLGAGLAGSLPAPFLFGAGTLQAGSPATLGLNGALAGAGPLLIAGLSALSAPFKGGTLVPQPQVIVPLPPVDGNGHSVLLFHWPAGLPASTTLYLQAWHADAGGPAGFAASNALAAVTP